MAESIVFSDRAAQKVKSLIDEDGNTDLMLRVFVFGGGCSGFSYGFTFDEVSEEGDTVFKNLDVRMIVDALSYPYLVGSKIDYREDLQGSEFFVTNPKASATCGCGNSFSI